MLLLVLLPKLLELSRVLLGCVLVLDYEGFLGTLVQMQLQHHSLIQETPPFLLVHYFRGSGLGCVGIGFHPAHLFTLRQVAFSPRSLDSSLFVLYPSFQMPTHYSLGKTSP